MTKLILRRLTANWKLLLAIFAGVNGYLDKIEVAQIAQFEESFLGEMRSQHAELVAEIRDQGEISEATEAKLKSILDDFSAKFA